MGKILLLTILASVGGAALFRPWIGIVTYYLLALLGPQYIWWWVFDGQRVSLVVAIASIVGVLMKFLNKRYDTSFLFNKQNGWLVFLWLCIVCSFFWGPYVSAFSFSGLGPKQIFSLYNTIFIFYFISVLEIDELYKLRYLFGILVVSTLFLTYWANIQYFSQNWAQFNHGRLMGPTSVFGQGIYRDENTFAMFFVSGLPFVYYLGWQIKKKWLKLLLWSFIPLGWHAIFLTGSRGGLLGSIVIMMTILILSNRKILAFPLVLVFMLFYQLQAGDVMHNRSEYIVNIEGENSAGDRITAWKGGLRIIMSHPITGVGLSSFITALPDYIESRHMVAHNTLVQFAAESGVGAGLAYLVIVGFFFNNALKIRRWTSAQPIDEEIQFIGLCNNASISSFSGLIVCSLFLSLNTYEVFFVLLLFNNALYQIYLRKFNPTFRSSFSRQ
ncbi:probable O-glycosylation ligase, exosortase A-associated [Desulfuromusa kysingii]|uniref:Probable O-glycosylation ligase, exosortase A-associated n=1 Tax=Desulfuromusa kysingii TaxID=37625 RepID=A0A1H4BAB7_9BACT|nr:O-antigen ligase family protein [Desulfuromusa kysingii]SEA45090.1 probable O-glycosylation ligase, exosortase A-associated [Desulfuromusa kysingii]